MDSLAQKNSLAQKKWDLYLRWYLAEDEEELYFDLRSLDDTTEASQRESLLCSPEAPNLDVIQEVEYVEQEAKTGRLLECLQKTPPPVLVFCEKIADVDDIHEYLLLKGVEALAIHGGKDQQEREYAIKSFKEGKKDVLVVTAVASKGLDFPDIQHVINYDMPEDIENYEHRVGRCGKNGTATTFINKNQSKTTLLDLKDLLEEAKQRIPPFLSELNDEDVEASTLAHCMLCRSLDHRILDCPKLEHLKIRRTSLKKKKKKDQADCKLKKRS